MKKNNLEQQIKSQLEGREIKPSSDLWDQLDRQLNNEKKGNPYRWFWLGIAAAIVLVFVSVPILNSLEQKENKIGPIPVVKTETNSNTETENLQDLPENKQSIPLVKDNKSIPNKVENTVAITTKNTPKKETSIQEKTQNIEAKNENIYVPNFQEKKPVEIAYSKDTVSNIKQKKSKHTDPGMLLYSIEFKENIKQSTSKQVIGFLQESVQNK